MRLVSKRLAASAALTAACAALTDTTRAYEQQLHREMSGVASQRALTLRDFAADLGIERRQLLADKRTMEEWMEQTVQDGSYWEDDLPRSLYHFFDPLTGKGLNQTFGPAPAWALGQVSGTDNFYSIPKAREEMYLALTATDFTVRQRAFA